MLVGRFLPIVFAVALAVYFSKKKPAAENAGTLPTHRPQFVGVMVGIAIIVGALTFLPTLVLGPLTEALS